MNNQSDKEILEFLQNTSEEFKILSEGTNMSLQQEYLKLSEEIDPIGYSEEIALEESKKLFDKSSTQEQKKKILIQLANTGSIESYRVLERHLKHDGRLKNWTMFAIQECRMHLGNMIKDENIGMISTGLGGKGNKLRCFIILISKTRKPFSDTQKKIIKQEYDISCKKLNSEGEKIDFQDDYATLTLLTPMDVAVDTVVMDGLKQCNKLGNFIIEYYYVTNVYIPNKAEIDEIVEDMRAETS
ncbi:hypothetical protein COW94_00080 [Candidatus Peregrinibacteria bacterium CG22_combo_CG10-13_8_21_14_all_44_10]|nr:MAG: hypothetical protein AUK45_05235 [Candidatus Peregrinibacteria bacterium CG2_30_44_17]PIP66757.1 MAG: hypothetical protein COW94_00080 [Candidatus Peregrinibacteria bacterium CG22_combo_CG10-13_8_21_14_all_44_10]PJB88705.1 MAG: hypothetical protein CO082_03645 [Candidatus Peregrinibacteria bacterium CG_4_9_14_0_8_um_filter_44_15]